MAKKPLKRDSKGVIRTPSGMRLSEKGAKAWLAYFNRK